MESILKLKLQTAGLVVGYVMGGFVLQQGSGGDCYDYDRDLNGPNVNNASTEHLNV